MRSQRSPRMSPLRASCQHQSSPNTAPLPTTTHRTTLSRIVNRICPWQLGACQRRFVQAHCHRGVWPSGVNASRRLSGKARSSPSDRTPWLDTYFLHTSMLGTHTFFLVFLPAFFFFEHDDLGRR
ncbi:hypothetical protein EDB85DRAFT_1618395 [Lactarius pseudohatsudake]|nr:hypothetical protein EDB85DRAFT_1618395 [Lactarius pseudohatsudake]